MTLGLSLGLGKAHMRGSALKTIDNLYLAIGGDSLALRCVSGGGNKAAFITEAERHYGSGNATIEGFAQGGLDTLKTWAQSNDPGSTVYFWDDDTNGPSSKLTGLIGSGITTPGNVNAVILFLGTNDANATLEAGFASTYTKAQYKTAFKALCENLYTTQFPNAAFIGIVPFHRNDQAAFAAQAYQAIIESQIEAADEVEYIKILPGIWDVDLADAVHPTGEETAPADNAYQDYMAPRLMEAVAGYHAVVEGAKTGPLISTAVLDSDRILVNLTHDKGTDIIVPTNAHYGFRVEDDGTPLTLAGVARTSATQFAIDLDGQDLNVGSSYSVYSSYGQTEALSRTGAEVITDNTASTLPVYQGVFTAGEGDPVRALSNLVLDLSARGGTRTLSGSDVTNVTDATGKNFVSSAGRYPEYDGTAFDNAGALVDTDGSTHMLSDTNFTKVSGGFFGLVFEIPSGAAADTEFFFFGTSAGGNQNIGFRYEHSDDRLRWRNKENGFQENITTGGIKGNRHILLANFKNNSVLDIYHNSTSVTLSVDPKDAMGNQDRLWLFARSTGASGLSGLKIARAFHNNAAHDSINDPSIATIMAHLNDKYSVGLSL